MRLDLMRLFLLARSQTEMFGQLPPHETIPDREGWLRRLFAEPVTFVHSNETFHYVPVTPAPDSRYVYGRIGRSLTIRENAPPEEGFKETGYESWRAAQIIIDPTAHEDGQKAAVERTKFVGRPLAILQSLAKQFNQADPPGPYALEVNAIIDPGTFLHFAQQNTGQVIGVTFELVSPNMFGMQDDLDREMKEVSEKKRPGD